MKTLMRNGRDRRLGKPVMGHAILERALLFGTRSADHIRASGHSGCIAMETRFSIRQQAEYMAAPERFAKRQIPLAPRAPSIHDPFRTSTGRCSQDCQRAGDTPRSGVVLRVADVFHPVDDLAVERFRNRDVRHRCGRRRAVPVLLARREPNDIARLDLLDWPALALREAAAGRHDQRLSERMRVPGRARAGLERDAGAADTRRIGRLEQRVDADRAGEPLGRSLAGRLCAVSLDIHRFGPSLADYCP
jgi:hypothetical protein